MTPAAPMPPDALVLAGGSGPLASGSHAVDFATWSPIEWGVYSAMALVCIWVLWRAVATTVRPNEDAPDHVKRMILGDEAPPPRPSDVSSSVGPPRADHPLALPPRAGS